MFNVVNLRGLFDASVDAEAYYSARSSTWHTYESEPALAFGRAVRAARVAQGVAQDDFAFQAGISRSHMGKIERGSMCLRFPDTENCYRARDQRQRVDGGD